MFKTKTKVLKTAGIGTLAALMFVISFIASASSGLLTASLLRMVAQNDVPSPTVVVPSGGLPDVVVSIDKIDRTSIVYASQPWTWVTYTVTNQGSASTGAPVYLRVISNGAPKSGYMKVNTLSAGASYTNSFAVGHDSAWPVGSYAIKLEADYRMEIEESNEMNNFSNEQAFTVSSTASGSAATTASGTSGQTATPTAVTTSGSGSGATETADTATSTTATTTSVSACPGPYHVLTADNRCVWSCGVGTTPDNASNQCVCQSGYVSNGTDSLGRLACKQQTAATTSTATPTTPATMSCGNSEGNDGLYSACVGDTVTHDPTGIKLKVVSYSQGNVLLSTNFNLQSGGTLHSLSLNKNVPVVSTLADGIQFTTTYTETSDQYGAFIQITSKTVTVTAPPAVSTTTATCIPANSAGNDGLYSGCVGDKITHYPTYITAKITSFNDSVVEVDLSGSSASHAWIYKNQPNRIYTADNQKSANFTYIKQSADSGAFIQISTVAPPTTTTNTTASCQSPYVFYLGKCVDPLPACKNPPENVMPSTCIDKIENGKYIERYNFKCLDGYTRSGAECVQTTTPVVSCPKPYHVLTSDNRCVWSCGEGTTPDSASNTCVCQSGYDKNGTDSLGRLMCEKTEVTMSCGNSAGDDGLYSGCVGDTITHKSTGIRFKVDSFDKDTLNLSTSGLSVQGRGAVRGLHLDRGSSWTDVLKDGTWLSVTFTETTPKHGAFIQIDSKKPATEMPSTVSAPVAVPATPTATPAPVPTTTTPVAPQTVNGVGFEDVVITNTSKNPFSDTDMNTRTGIAAATLHAMGIIGGYADGTFRPNQTVNRAEAAKFLLLGSDHSVQELRNDGKFWDVLDGQWYTPFIMNAYAYGIMSGNPDGSMRPANSVNTAEFLKMLTLAFKLETNLPYSYKDVPEDAWFAQYAGIAQKYNLFPGRSSELAPGKALNRAEVAVAIYQYLNNKGAVGITTPGF